MDDELVEKMVNIILDLEKRVQELEERNCHENKLEDNQVVFNSLTKISDTDNSKSTDNLEDSCYSAADLAIEHFKKVPPKRRFES